MVRPLKYTSQARIEQYETYRAVYGILDRDTYNKEIERLNKAELRARKAKAKREAEREAREIERERQERIREAQLERQREEKRQQQKLLQNIKRKQLRQEQKAKKAISFDSLEQWVNRNIGNKELPFRLRLQSSVANVFRIFNFKSYYHFQNWLESVEKQATITESENYKKIADATGDEDVFNFVIPEFMTLSGGCNRHKDEQIVKETPYFTLHLFNPIGQHNNCGFRIIEHLTGQKLNYAQLRKDYNLKYDEQITPDIMNKIYRASNNISRFLVFIDDNFNSEMNKNYHYIYVADNHYYFVENAKYKTFVDKKTKRGYLYWDIETRPTEEYVMVGNNKSYILKDTILCAYYSSYKKENYEKITFRTTSEKSSCRQFLDWLSIEANEGRFYHCIAHNGSRFDCYFLLSYLNEQEQLHTETQLRGYSIIGLQYKSHLFKDSCCFLTASLDSLCNAFKVKQAKLTEFTYNDEKLTNKNICFYKPHLTFDEFMSLQKNEPEFWNLYEEYCMYDCIGLMNVWSSFKEQITGLTDIIFKYKPELKAKVDLMGTNTIGSLSKKILENSCLVSSQGKNGKTCYVKSPAYKTYLDFVSQWVITNGKKLKVVDAEKIQFINKFKRGGISHSNQAGKHTHSLISYDIASQYPASMMYMLIPCGNSQWTDKYNKMYHGYYELSDLVFDTPYKFKPVASKNENGVLVWDNKNIDSIFLDSFMIKYMMEHYGLKTFNVVRGLVSTSYIQGNKIFGDYVETLYNEKKQQDEYKKTGHEKYNPALRECIKLFLNSLSGKLVEDPSRYFKLAYTIDDSKLKLNGIDAEKTFDEEKYNHWVSAGVMVYSYSKRLLFEYVRCLPNDSDDVIHIETDSIYFNKKNNETFIQNIKNYIQPKIGVYPVAIGADLGNVKVEKDTDEVSYFLGKKFYCIGDLYKIKGIPLKTIDEYGNDVELVNTQLYEDIYNGKSVVKEFYTMKKALFADRTYISSHKMKRTINPNMKYAEFN